ncbi:MAG: short-chain dehydrogenase [Verrucomicrobia bacterium]|nr:MAG: short-chain dehydrogenase [Verrucomicrobiota bacterium]
MRLADKVIIVTGSTTGIGKAIARRCLEEGARVLIHGLEPDLGDDTRAELDPGGERTALLIRDLTESAAPTEVVETAVSAFGRLDALVNNAGKVGTGTLQDTDEKKFDSFMATNVRAPFFLIQAALPHLKKTRGNILNIGSVNAHAGEANLVPYSISKGALMTLTRNLGDTLPREEGVRVNQINPGWILTEGEFQRYKDQGRADDWPSHLSTLFAPSRRLFRPEEVAAAAIYFLGDESGPVSGSVLDIEQHTFLGRNLLKF